MFRLTGCCYGLINNICHTWNMQSKKNLLTNDSKVYYVVFKMSLEKGQLIFHMTMKKHQGTKILCRHIPDFTFQRQPVSTFTAKLTGLGTEQVKVTCVWGFINSHQLFHRGELRHSLSGLGSQTGKSPALPTSSYGSSNLVPHHLPSARTPFTQLQGHRSLTPRPNLWHRAAFSDVP